MKRTVSIYYTHFLTQKKSVLLKICPSLGDCSFYCKQRTFPQYTQSGWWLAVVLDTKPNRFSQRVYPCFRYIPHCAGSKCKVLVITLVCACSSVVLSVGLFVYLFFGYNIRFSPMSAKTMQYLFTLCLCLSVGLSVCLSVCSLDTSVFSAVM